MTRSWSERRHHVMGITAGIIMAGVLFTGPDATWGQGGGGNGGGQGKDKSEIQEEVEMAASTKITIHDAIKAASEQVPGTVIEAELEEKPVVVWEVEIVTSEGKVMEVLVDKTTGSVLAVEEEQPEEEKPEKEKDPCCMPMKMHKRMHQGQGMGMR